MSRDVLAISRLFSNRIYKAARFFINSESVVKGRCSVVIIVTGISGYFGGFSFG